MGIVALVVLIIVAAAVVAAVWVQRRNKWIGEFAAKGWQFVDAVDISAAHGLNVPPFGLGDNRKVRNMVVGEIDGVPFKALDYHSDDFHGWVAVFPLLRSYPALHLGIVPTEAVGHPIDVPGAPPIVSHGRTAHPALDNALVPALAPALAPFEQLQPLSISLDGAALTLTPVPDKADALEPYLQAGAGLCRAIAGVEDRLTEIPQPPVPTELSVYGYPQWTYRLRDDSALNRVRHDRDGYDHQARRVLFSSEGPLPFIALRHHWKTRERERNSDGKWETTVKNHNETIIEIDAPRAFLDFSVNSWKFTQRAIRFESSRFNDDFKVRSPNAKFAHDVMHPRMMEYLEASRPPGFDIDSGVIRPNIKHDPGAIAETLAFLEGFFARVPSFVWDDLGYREHPFTPVP